MHEEFGKLPRAIEWPRGKGGKPQQPTPEKKMYRAKRIDKHEQTHSALMSQTGITSTSHVDLQMHTCYVTITTGARV